MAVDSDGNLQITLPTNPKSKNQNPKLTELAPVAWQEVGGQRIPVSTSYAVSADGAIGFALGSYDTSRALIIDPTLEFSTYLGGGDDDIGYAIATGPSGVYVTGSTQATTFPLVNPIQALNHGGEDVFVTMLSPDGQSVIYSTYLGGGNNDEGLGIAVDSSGNAYVTGSANSSNFPTTSGAYQTVSHGSTEAFIAKLSTSGSTLVYSTFLGPAQPRQARLSPSIPMAMHT